MEMKKPELIQSEVEQLVEITEIIPLQPTFDDLSKDIWEEWPPSD